MGASPYDRMQADVKALQQQAQATQESLKKLQTQEAADPFDGTSLGVASVLVVVLALVGWYVWHRPKNRPVDAGHTQMSDLTEDSAYGQPPPPKPMEQTQKAPPVQESPATPPPTPTPTPAPIPIPVPSSPFAKPEPSIGFDSEAAATEVMRVRKSLAEKREARFLLLDQEGPAVEAGPADRAPDPQPAMVDPWNVPGEGAYREAPPSFDIDIHFTLPDDPDASGALHEPEPRPGPDDFLDAIELDFNLDEPGSAVQQDLESVAVETEPELAVTGPVAPDYATTLALAQVSEELEQLNEARDLAYEVLQSDDPALQSEARALLDRLSEVESEMGPESIRWDDLR